MDNQEVLIVREIYEEIDKEMLTLVVEERTKHENRVIVDRPLDHTFQKAMTKVKKNRDYRISEAKQGKFSLSYRTQYMLT